MTLKHRIFSYRLNKSDLSVCVCSWLVMNILHIELWKCIARIFFVRKLINAPPPLPNLGIEIHLTLLKNLNIHFISTILS